MANCLADRASAWLFFGVGDVMIHALNMFIGHNNIMHTFCLRCSKNSESTFHNSHWPKNTATEHTSKTVL